MSIIRPAFFMNQFATTGTDDYELGSEEATFLTPLDNSHVSSGEYIMYDAVNSLTNPTKRELGIGIVTTGSPPVIGRSDANVFYSTNSNNRVDWDPGTKYIFGSVVPKYMATFGTLNELARPSEQVGFLAYLGSASLTSVTGNGALYTIVWDTTSHNVGGGFNTSTGIFTAPVAGMYDLKASVDMIIPNSGMVSADVTINTEDFDYSIWRGNPYAARISGSNQTLINGGVTAFLDVGDTAKVTVQVEGGPSDSASVSWGSATTLVSYFAGRLLV